MAGPRPASSMPSVTRTDVRATAFVLPPGGMSAQRRGDVVERAPGADLEVEDEGVGHAGPVLEAAGEIGEGVASGAGQRRAELAVEVGSAAHERMIRSVL